MTALPFLSIIIARIESEIPDLFERGRANRWINETQGNAWTHRTAILRAAVGDPTLSTEEVDAIAGDYADWSVEQYQAYKAYLETVRGGAA